MFLSGSRKGAFRGSIVGQIGWQNSCHGKTRWDHQSFAGAFVVLAHLGRQFVDQSHGDTFGAVSDLCA